MCASIFWRYSFLRVFGRDFQVLLRFEVHENGGLAEIGLHFLGIEHVEQDDFVAMEAQRLDGANDFLGRFVEIGNHQHQAAAAQKFLEVVQRLGEIGARARLGKFEPGRSRCSWPCRVDGRI